VKIKWFGDEQSTEVQNAAASFMTEIANKYASDQVLDRKM